MSNHADEELKPKRRSFLQMTRELLSPKASTVEDQKVKVVTPLPSPVQLPHIEQLEPIGTDISSEIQFQRMNDEKVDTEEANEPTILDAPNDDRQEARTEDQHLIVTEEEEEDQQNKKDHPKRSSLLLKFLFPKRTSDQDAPEEPDEAPSRPSSPLGRRVSALLSHIPARKEKLGKLELAEDLDVHEQQRGVATTA